jgi:hypothetical protein
VSISDPIGKFNGRELEYLSSFLDSEIKENKIPWVQRFEESVAKKLGVKYAIACNSGTSGLHMAMVACGIGLGDEVITPGLTVVMDAYSVIHVGAKPVFADVDRSTYGIDVSEYAIENAKEEVRDFCKVANAISLPFDDQSVDVSISITTLHNLEEKDLIKALLEIERISRKGSFITLDAYRNNEEKDRMEAWNLTAKTVMHVDDWKDFFNDVGYTGDYYWFIP